MKFFSFIFLLASCASQVKYPDKNKNQKEYSKQEQINLEKSLYKSEVMALLKAMDSRINAVNSQINTQQNIIKRYEAENLASSEAMIENAKIRILQLEEEKASLAAEKEKIKKRYPSKTLSMSLVFPMNPAMANAPLFSILEIFSKSGKDRNSQY
jgi:hypothetical protein